MMIDKEDLSGTALEFPGGDAVGGGDIQAAGCWGSGNYSCQQCVGPCNGSCDCFYGNHCLAVCPNRSVG